MRILALFICFLLIGCNKSKKEAQNYLKKIVGDWSLTHEESISSVSGNPNSSSSIYSTDQNAELKIKSNFSIVQKTHNEINYRGNADFYFQGPLDYFSFTINQEKYEYKTDTIRKIGEDEYTGKYEGINNQGEWQWFFYSQQKNLIYLRNE